MARKRKDYDEKLNGSFNVKELVSALVEINQDLSIDTTSVKGILQESLLKAYKDWWCNKNGFAPSNASDLLAEISVDWEKGQIHIYDVKKVLNEDDIQDDFVEISLEEAQKDNPDLKVGDLWKKEIDYSKLDKGYIRRVVADFHQRMREKAKEILKSSYQDKIHQLIVGTITRVDSPSGIEIDFGRTTGYLSKRDILPTDPVAVGQQIKVYLVDVGERDGKPTLIISRTNEGYIKALFAEEIPEVGSGDVEIVRVVRQAGLRSKVFVRSHKENVDPVGALIGSNSVRYRSVLAELGKETVDVLKWEDNPELLVIEALKPAKIIGIRKPENPEDPLIAICMNNDKKVAVGRLGSNVRLAGRVVGHEIRILEVDEALKEKLSYISTDAIIASNTPKVEEPKAPVSEPVNEEVEEEVDKEMGLQHEEAAPVSEEKKAEPVQIEKPIKPVEQTQSSEEEKPVVASKVEAKPEVKVEAPVVEAKKEEVKPVEQAKPIEPKPEEKPVEIKGRAKVSLEALEQQIEKERQSQGTRPSFKKYVKPSVDKKVEEEKNKEQAKEVEEAKKNAMPIYTPEELSEIEKEENSEDDSNTNDDIDYDQYDDDSYYDDDSKGHK